MSKGEKLSKLDLSHAYQQLLLAPESRSLTVNTHKGLFQPRCLQFGVQSASSIFQRENRLSKAPSVKVCADNRLVSGKSTSENLENLESVFEIIKNVPYKKVSQDLTNKKQDLTEMRRILMALPEILCYQDLIIISLKNLGLTRLISVRVNEH